MLAGRVTTEDKRHGSGFAPLKPCWAPGTRVEAEKRFIIGSNNILQSPK